jgi:hypothetical protein
MFSGLLSSPGAEGVILDEPFPLTVSFEDLQRRQL